MPENFEMPQSYILLVNQSDLAFFFGFSAACSYIAALSQQPELMDTVATHADVASGKAEGPEAVPGT